jgi:hypothetical protein
MYLQKLFTVKFFYIPYIIYLFCTVQMKIK